MRDVRLHWREGGDSICSIENVRQMIGERRIMAEAKTAKKRLVYIDVLRVLSMVTILVCHFLNAILTYGVTVPWEVSLTPLFRVYLGNVGVSVFFILSGASLMCTYAGNLDVKKYAKKRFLGIYPMFWTAYAAAFLYFFVKDTVFIKSAPNVTFIWTILGMDGYLTWYGANFYLLGEWFLGCLLLLYVLFPFLKRGVEKQWMVVTAIVAVVMIAGPIVYDGKIPVENFFLFRTAEFLFGMAFVYFGKKVKWPAAVAAAVILVILQFVDLSFIPTVYRNPVIGISLFLLITFLCENICLPRLFRLCKNIAPYCYPVFLVHHIILHELFTRFSNHGLGYTQVAALFLSFLILTTFFSICLMKFNKTVVSWVQEMMHAE